MGLYAIKMGSACLNYGELLLTLPKYYTYRYEKGFAIGLGRS